MNRTETRVIRRIVVLLFAPVLCNAFADTPETVPLCELARKPGEYVEKMIAVRGHLVVSDEGLFLVDEKCSAEGASSETVDGAGIRLRGAARIALL